MKKILEKLFAYKTLDREEARQVLTAVAKGQYQETEVTAFVTVFLMRSITLPELQGFVDALRDLMFPVHLGDAPVLDIVGTGGDGKNTFNISTLSCFIAAGAGQKVAKHGNYGASSVSGSSNVMEQLGYRFTNEEARLQEQLNEAGICFLHAPLFHPALKTVAPIRRSLGLRTFFNLLGPMVNPARPAFKLLGVSNAEIARLYNYLLQEEGGMYRIIHTLDGYDEISLTSDTRVISESGERTCSALELGKRPVLAADLTGGNSVEEAARIFMTILQGKGTWAQNAVVLANAAMALHATGNFGNYDACYHRAVESLEQGAAYATLEKLLALQKN